MFGLFDKFKTAKHSNDILKEYVKILTLEEKRKKLQVEYGDDAPVEIAQTQRDILKNNLLNLSHLAVDKEALPYSDSALDNGVYFNIQGSKPKVNITHLDLSSREIADKTGVHKSLMKRTDSGLFSGLTNDLLKIETVFMTLKHKKIKQSVKNFLASKAEAKMVRKIHEFCDNFKGNEQLFKNYIFSGIDGLNEDDHWHNYDLMRARLNIIGLITIEGDFTNSEKFDIAPKELIHIDDANNNLDIELEAFLLLIDTKIYDFVICESYKAQSKSKQKGGNKSE